MTLLLRSRK